MKDASKIINGIEFTSREIEIISLLVNGKSYKEIGILIDISPRTVESHIRSIMSKMKCNSKREIFDFIDASNEHKLFNELFHKFYQQALPATNKSKRWIIIFSLFAGISCFCVYWYFFFSGNADKTNNIIVQNENYLDRYNYISKIKEILSNQDKIKSAVIIGLGGSGKTTIARKFLQISDSEISWEINAETNHSIFSSFMELAESIAKTKDQRNELEIIKSITNSDEKRRLLIKFVSSILRKYKNWILLFDNVEDFSVISDYLPQNKFIWGSGILLLTTRNKNLTHSSRIKQGTDVNIENLSPYEQYTLFCKILYGQECIKLSKQKEYEIKEFLKRIPSMPLDISAAAYYLKNTNASFDDYIKITERSTEDFEKIQSKLLEESINYSKTRYGIIVSTFEEIIRQNKNFKALLLFVCLLDSQRIPKKVLKDVIDPVQVDNFIYNLRKHSLITYDDDKISIHRSTQNIGLSYLMDSISLEEKEALIKRLVSQITPYKYLDSNYNDVTGLIPHLKSFLNKIDRLLATDPSADKYKIDLLITLADIYRYKAYRMVDSLDCFKKALGINRICKYLNQSDIASINLKIGEVYTLMSDNDNAMSYLEKSLPHLSDNFMELAKSYRLIGIIYMRKNNFDEANKCFEKAIFESEKEKVDSISLREVRSNIHADMAFNYFMDGINRDNAIKAAEIMKKAVEILVDVKNDPGSNAKAAGKLVIHISRLAGIYNALGEYDLALKTSQEAEDIIKKMVIDSDIIYAQGIIARERGLSHLRLNKVKEAYDYFMEAKRIFTEARVGAYLFRLKMHEVESLIRINRLEEAYKVCEEMFSTKDRERNNYCDLFFNTCYYHAAVIKYRKGDINASRKHFTEFFQSMRILCKNILSKDKYDELIKQNAFEESSNSFKKYFENSLKVFEAIYWKDYEFTKFYVEENLKNL